ncbi:MULTISPECIES: hypothetical protein [Bacillus]|jgi:DNA-binding MarR family transcriptional regulator|uniref:Group-specific protein n=2 Tax=Bacillus cereus group TaxID=86661 RepID=A0A9X5VFI5_BACCE|nr:MULTISPECIES: hypothetical protein [Bacillus]MBR3336558.1 hypothetical protein [Bacillus sp. (in: firmicutes)]MDV8111545.1 hypothetical protein [Bacillus sp. BAU-SS-2023]CJC64820.1 RNA polymerase sigma factor%2C sigma-70 family [Streptococcus pneumoniae]AQQ61488.1 hypothetical Protein FORC21_0693 [Bacillus cereus]ARV96158.1 hypothetical protein BJG91_27595 [Bacillus thuringiensis]
MYKKIAVSMTMAALLCGAIIFPASAATPKEVTMHHHKPISDEEIQSLEKLGYNKHEIWKAAHIARISNKEIQDVLAYYKQNKSWEKTAEHFGIDPSKLKKHHMNKETKQALLQQLATMQKSTPDQLKQKMKEYNIKLRHLTVLTIISQKSNTPLDDVLKMKKDGMDIKQIAEKLNVKREDIRAEMMKLVKSIKEQKTN